MMEEQFKRGLRKTTLNTNGTFLKKVPSHPSPEPLPSLVKKRHKGNYGPTMEPSNWRQGGFHPLDASIILQLCSYPTGLPCCILYKSVQKLIKLYLPDELRSSNNITSLVFILTSGGLRKFVRFIDDTRTPVKPEMVTMHTKVYLKYVSAERIKLLK